MKKVFLLIAVAAFTFACGNSATQQEEGCTAAKTECASHVDGEECAKKACSKEEGKECAKKEGEGCCSKKAEGEKKCEGKEEGKGCCKDKK
jgi:hypothetical protein